MGCDENFGLPPAAGGGPVVVVEEGAVGPSDPLRVPRLVDGGPEVFFVALDRGTWRLRPGDGAWLPGPAMLGYRRVLSLDVASGGRLWAATDGSEVFGSTDGGEIFQSFSSPAPGSPLGRVLALPASPFRAGGGWLVSAGAALHRRAVGESGWTRVSLPVGSVASWGPWAADGAGRVAVAVEVDGNRRLWTSEDGGGSFRDGGVLGAGPIFALGFDPSGQPLWIDGDGVHRVGGTLAGWPGEPTAGAAESDGWLAVVSADTLWWGLSTGTPQPAPCPFDPDPAAGLAVSEGGVLVASADGALWQRADGNWFRHPLTGPPLDMGTVAVDPRRPGLLLLAGGGRGRVWEGRPAGPWTDRGIPSQPSVQALLADPGREGALLAATYGVQYQPAPTAGWEQRNDGQSSYLCGIGAGGPVVAQALVADPAGDVLWLGAINGDGPYRSRNGGLLWEPVHENLGPLGDCFEGSGLRRITQARAFAFGQGETWMGGFQGGVWRLDAETGSWRGVNRGLPDAFGSPVDTCCVGPFELAVDVRDLVALSDGTLLAATGWGIYRRPPGAVRWEFSSQGLVNSDVWILAVHPLDSRWILAGCSGKVDTPGWLHLSRDGGRRWTEVPSVLQARRVKALVWLDPVDFEAVAVLDWSGVWRLRLRP
jgi:hypothetical protein